MADITSKLSAVLSGTSNNRKTRILTHVIFWALMYIWFDQQARWLVGNVFPELTLAVALAKMGLAILLFYLVSGISGSRLNIIWKLTGICLLLVGTFLTYGLVIYQAYTYLSITSPTTPKYVRSLAASMSAQGPWTFLYSTDILYFHVQQLLMGILLPLIIKGLRMVFKSRYKSMLLEKDNLKLELDFLRSQINPHFLFNTLNSVYALVEDKDQTAASVVYSLSNIMRFALYDSNTTEVEVEKELDTIRNYLDIQTVRHSKRLTIDWEISEHLGQQYIPPLLLLTFVENAIKHGVDKYINQSCIAIKAYRNVAGVFCFEVTNSLPPRNQAVATKGIGISNTRRRLQLLYPDSHTLQINQTENMHHVLLKIW